jgi:translation initiation factor 4A
MSDEEAINWDDFDLNDDILRGVYRYGFEKPTPIQCLTIRHIIDKKDLIGQAQSGTGKTGSFTVAALQRIDFDKETTQCIIIAPTRELVKQIHQVLTNIGNAIEKLSTYVLVGGDSVSDNIKYLKKHSPHIIIGTTGRINDMTQRRMLNTENVDLLVLDEADEMLSKGFKEQIHTLLQYLPGRMQIVLFSATLPNDVLKLTEKFMHEPVKITLKPEELTLDCIKQFYIALPDERSKFDTLKDLFSVLQVNQSIIYVNTIDKVNDLYNAMTEEGYPVSYIHSGMTKSERETALMQFKNGKFRVLISSGVTSRGIDIQQVSTVINFDIPKDVNTYLHAIGRSGRYGRKGLAINFITKYDVSTMRRIEKRYKINIDELPSNVNELI